MLSRSTLCRLQGGAGGALERACVAPRRNQQRRRRAATAVPMAAAGGGAGRVIALDFDGVVCDSVGESSLSAFKAAALKWPEIFATPEAEAAKPRLVEQMRAVRPVVETGYENVVQIRALYEGTGVEEMLAGWHAGMLAGMMERWQLDRGELVTLFGRVRDEWIAADLPGWLAPNRIYPGVADAVKASLAGGDEVYVVTTKQARFTHTLLRDMAGVDLPADRIHSTTVSGEPKSRVLARLAAQHAGAGGYVFVEDKYSTLEKVIAAPETAGKWDLYLVDWGYNTPDERAAAAASPNIRLIGVGEFAKLMAGGGAAR
ncbi:hypothetical protein Rsub_08069 [Raphidocelis subcapitata]|uniref:Uncharacterized protein n=1 Tax=Raphidocelis subcapitata TaxID=307507 RepID=A0A2V0P7X6_9CHLO|nr:hypothetical protein Rsub_08069 [Raphidocelis subcapitata]|eukprot:GBF95946.1 hypothetical protein Rsub_08069 [Raphidocelis subcapitata]